MAQIVEPNADQTGSPRNRSPRSIQIGPGLVRVIARHDEFGDPRKVREDGESWRVEHDVATSDFTVGDKRQAAFPVNVLPAKVKYFAQPAPSQQKKSDRCHRMPSENCTPDPLWDMLGGGFSFVNFPLDADRLGLV